MLCEHIKGSRRQQWPSKSRPGQEQPQNLWLLILIWECKRALTLTPTVIPPSICSILHSFHPLFLLLFTKHFCSSLPRLLGHWLTRHSSRTDASSQIVWMLKPPSTLYIVKHSQWTGKVTVSMEILGKTPAVFSGGEYCFSWTYWAFILICPFLSYLVSLQL